MSVSSLGGILRRLRRDIAERATFRNGTVVEMIDATHVLVDIGKPVPAFCSPIFLPAVVVGTPVTVRIQGSHYDVVDAPLADARLVTSAEIASFSAGGGGTELGVELLPNGMGWLSSSWWAGAELPTECRWYFNNPSEWPPWTWSTGSFCKIGADGETAVFLQQGSPVLNAPWRVWPAPPGGVPVTAGGTYRTKADLLTLAAAQTTPVWTAIDPTSYAASCTISLEWYDAGGTLISTVVSDGVQWYDYDPTRWYYKPGYNADKLCGMAELITIAPTGAAFARPMIECNYWPLLISHPSIKRTR